MEELPDLQMLHTAIFQTTSNTSCKDCTKIYCIAINLAIYFVEVTDM